MEVVHDFEEKLAEGAKGEEIAFGFLSRWGDVAYVTEPSEQRRGFDLVLVPKKDDGRGAITFEVKIDYAAEKTGNVYLETASVVTHDGVKKPGWIFTSEADRLITIIPQGGLYNLYIFDLAVLRRWVENNWPGLRTASAKNEAYYSQGLLAPIGDIAPLALFKEKITWPMMG